MTIEKAIFILANIDRRVCDDELSEALDMAIEVLEQLKEKPEYIDTQHVGMVLRNVPKQPDNCKIYDGICGYPIEACSECPMHPKKTYIDADMLKEIKGIFNKPNVATILPDETYITPSYNSIKTELKPCYDCISRVLEYIEASDAELGHSSENELVCQDIKELLPVIPQQTGRWIKGDSYGDQYNYYQSYVCSCCKCECDDVHGWKYCPNCGAKMESEE